MSLTSSAVSSSEDPTLPPFHAVRPFVPPEEFLPFIRTSVQTKHPFRLDYLFPDPPQWLDNLIPIVGVSIATGTLIGLYKGGATRAARFTAENAHRKPRRLKAWFYYKRSKNYNVLLGATGSAVKYSFRLTTLLCSFSLLSSLFSQSFKKAKIWRDEDRLARSLVRNYDGLGNSKTEEEEKEAGGEGTMQRLWPNEDGFELWDWVGGVGSGMAAGGIMTVGLGLYRHWYPPSILVPALYAMVGGGCHGALNLYNARDRRERRVERIALRDKLLRGEEAKEDNAKWEELERLKMEEVKRRLGEEEKRLQEERVKEKKGKGEWVGWVLAMMGGK